MIVSLLLSAIIVSVATAFPATKLPFVPESFLQTAPWIFGGKPIALPVSVEDCFDILADDGSWELWFPEVQNIQNLSPPSTEGYRRVVNFNAKATDFILSTPSLVTEGGGVSQSNKSTGTTKGVYDRKATK